MHHTIQTKFTDQTTGIMKLKPMHVILYQNKKQKLDNIEMKSLQNRPPLETLKNTIHLHGMFI